MSEPDAIMALRVEMANEGWSSHDRLTKLGWGNITGYSVYFERYDWHGGRTGGVVFHAHTPDLAQMLRAAQHAAALARKAWATFGRDQIPRQTSDGRDVELDAFLTRWVAEREACTTPEQWAEYDARYLENVALGELRDRDNYARLRARYEGADFLLADPARGA